jgi:hypothetical protein
VLAVAGSAPLTSACRVLRSPSEPAGAFILATNAACEPASQRASREAILLPEGAEHRLQRLELGQVLPAHDLDDRLPCRWSLAKAAASTAVAMPRRGQYSRAADTPRAFRAWPVPCPRRQARLRLTMLHCGALGSWLRRQ